MQRICAFCLVLGHGRVCDGDRCAGVDEHSWLRLGDYISSICTFLLFFHGGLIIAYVYHLFCSLFVEMRGAVISELLNSSPVC